MPAAGEGFDAGEHGGFVKVEFGAHDGVAAKNRELALGINQPGVRVVGVALAGELRPLFANGVLGRGAADAVFDQEFFNQRP